MNQVLLHLALVFAGLSMLAIGGGSSLLPEMKRVCVSQNWIDPEGFAETYSLGQIAPGPPMTMVVLLGYRAAGAAGAAVVMLSFFTPACTLTWFVSRAWDRFAGSPWPRAIEDGLAPISIGLLVSGALAIGQGAIHEAFTLVLAGLALALSVGVNLNPALLVIGCGLLGLARSYYS